MENLNNEEISISILKDENDDDFSAGTCLYERRSLMPNLEIQLPSIDLSLNGGSVILSQGE